MSATDHSLPENLPTVLVIDDDQSMREFVVLALKRLGYSAVAGSNAEEALAAVGQTPTLRLLLSDVCLAEGSGPDLVRRVLRTRPDLKVVFMSGGLGDVPFRSTDPLLSKPFNLARLRSAIEDALDASHSRDSSQPPFAGERRRAQRPVDKFE